MTDVRFDHIEGANPSATLYFSDGEKPAVMTITPATHQTYSLVMQMLVDGSPSAAEIRRLVTPVIDIAQSLKRVSEQVTFDGRNLFFDGDPIPPALNQHMLRICAEKKKGFKAKSFKALLKFLEKLYQNPSENSRQSLYEYIVRYNITLTTDGDMLLYKGVRSDGTSIHSGPGIVDGTSYVKAHLPNTKGSVLEMSRSRVDADTAVGCSTGLHAGTYEYAKGFAQGMLLTVLVNPRDVVSVPDHCSFQKLRVCRYRVLDTTELEYLAPTFDERDECDCEDECKCEYCEFCDELVDNCKCEFCEYGHPVDECECDEDDEDEDEDDEDEGDEDEDRTRYNGACGGKPTYRVPGVNYN